MKIRKRAKDIFIVTDSTPRDFKIEKRFKQKKLKEKFVDIINTVSFRFAGRHNVMEY